MKKYIVTVIAALVMVSCSSNEATSNEATSNEATCNATCADTCVGASYLDTNTVAPVATSVETSTVK